MSAIANANSTASDEIHPQRLICFRDLLIFRDCMIASTSSTSSYLTSAVVARIEQHKITRGKCRIASHLPTRYASTTCFRPAQVRSPKLEHQCLRFDESKRSPFMQNNSRLRSMLVNVSFLVSQSISASVSRPNPLSVTTTLSNSTLLLKLMFLTTHCSNQYSSTTNCAAVRQQSPRLLLHQFRCLNTAINKTTNVSDIQILRLVFALLTRQAECHHSPIRNIRAFIFASSY